ncbi:MAG: hypothetical protein K2J37_01455 [Ruminococcus sp.]|nr:hypothetical protein [Ruminococcus sp.]MDE6785303.1 hypothetical protein [Ruminococcus sp.]
MITPFENEWVREHIEGVAKDSKDSAKLNNFIFGYEWFEEEIIALNMGYEAWTAALLYDTVFNDIDYSLYCTGYEELYSRAVENLKKDLSRKKLLSFKPLYNIPEILQNAVDTIDSVLGIVNESELAEEMQKKGIFEKWRSEIIDLQNRLTIHV